MRHRQGGREQERIGGRGCRKRVRRPHEGRRLLHAAHEEVRRADDEQHREDVLPRRLRVLDLERVEREEHAPDQRDSRAEQPAKQQKEDQCGRRGVQHGRRARGPLAAVAAGEEMQRREVQAAVRLAVHDQVPEGMPRQARQGDADGLVGGEALRAEARKSRRERHCGRDKGQRPPG